MCQVLTNFGDYHEKVWCDVVTMDIAHVLLGQPWLYDRDVVNYGCSNTYFFQHSDQKIRLNPTPPKELRALTSKGQVFLPNSISSIDLVRMKALVHKARESKTAYALMVHEISMKSSKPMTEVSKEVMDLLH